MLSMRREYDKRVDQCEDRMSQLQTDMQKEIDKHDEQLRKVTKERDDAQEEANDTHRGAISLFNESKRYEFHSGEVHSEVHRANNAVDKMRD